MKITNKQGLPVPLYDALAKDTYRKVGDFSATEIIAPPRIRILKKLFFGKIKVDCSEYIFRLFGNLIHELLNIADVKDALQEERLIIPVNGCLLSGAPDLYDGDDIVWDFKVTSRWVSVFGAKDDWEKQLNIYAFLLKKHLFPVRGAKVCAIFRDWSKTQAVRDREYPQQQVEVFNILLWPEEVQWGYIQDRVSLHQSCEKLHSLSLPYCTPEERWAKEDKFAVMKKGRKTALRVLDSMENAKNWMVGNLEEKELDSGIYTIEKRLGESTRCEYYCEVADFCNQYQETIKEKT